jgi:acyl carrier protein
MHDTASRVERILRTELHLGVEHRDLNLVDAGLLDSLTFMDLIVCVEREFGITIGLEALAIDAVSSVTRIVDFVESQRAT